LGPFVLAAGMALPATALVTAPALAAKTAKTNHKAKKSPPKANKDTAPHKKTKK
jgi:hypothetical protein